MSEQGAPTNLPQDTPDGDAAEADASPFVISLPDDPNSQKDWYLWAGVLAIFCLVAFWPAMQGSFLWDDDHYVSQNLALRTWKGLVHIWAPPVSTVQYYPLTYTMFWLEWHVWKTWSVGYHVINLLLHAGSAVVVWRLLRRLAVPGAWAAAALWAIHPMQVESVCWISERKNILSGLLFFGALWYYLKFAGVSADEKENTEPKLADNWRAYAISFGLFTLALFAKTVACSLPVVLLLILWWKRKLARDAIVGLIPYFILGLALAAVTAKMETSTAGSVVASGSDWDQTFVQRILIAGRGVWFYAGHLIAPTNLSFNYARLVPDPHDMRQWIYVFSAMAVLALVAGLVRIIGRGPLVALLFYGVTLFPSLGFVNVFPFRYSFVADHFQYMSGLGLIVLGAAALARLFGNFSPAKVVEDAEGQHPTPSPAQISAAVLATIVAIVLASMSWFRSDVFKENAALWKDTLEKNPKSWLAANNLGIERAAQVNLDLNTAHAAWLQHEEDSYEQYLKDANAQAIVAAQLVEQVLANPAIPDTTRYLCYNTLGMIEQSRADFPGADPIPCYEKAAAQFAISIAGEKAVNEKANWNSPDPTPFLNMGIIQLKYADQLQAKLPEPARPKAPAVAATTRSIAATSASTRATTTQYATSRPALPATRRASDDEKMVMNKAMEAADYLSQAVGLGSTALHIPRLSQRAMQALALAEFNRAEAHFVLASMAQRRYDTPEADRQTVAARNDYFESLKIENNNMRALYRLALCLEALDDLDGANYYMKQAILMSPNNFNPDAYNAIGRILGKRVATSNSAADMIASIKSFEAAIQQRPNFTEAKENLQLALIQVASATRPSTQPTTRSAATLPAKP